MRTRDVFLVMWRFMWADRSGTTNGLCVNTPRLQNNNSLCPPLSTLRLSLDFAQVRCLRISNVQAIPAVSEVIAVLRDSNACVLVIGRCLVHIPGLSLKKSVGGY